MGGKKGSKEPFALEDSDRKKIYRARETKKRTEISKRGQSPNPTEKVKSAKVFREKGMEC